MSSNTDRFLVTGALGCIGAWAVRNLVRTGIPVVAFDRAADLHRLELIMTADEISTVALVHGDITDLPALERALDEYEITHVIHLAGMLMPACAADPPLGARVNVVGTVNVFEAVARRKGRIGAVTYASSVAVYDAPDAEATGTVITHYTTTHPASLYGVYKTAIEGIARVYWQERGIAGIGLRPATVYGPGRDTGITAAPTRAMFAAAVGAPYHIPYGGRGEFQYADDVAQIFIACARLPFAGSDVFNLHGSVARMDEIVAAIEGEAPRARETITFSDVSFPSPEEFDGDPLSNLIGSLPRTPLQSGVAKTIAVFREAISGGILSPNALLR